MDYGWRCARRNDSVRDSMQDTRSLYDYVPMSERKPLKWPNGKRLALLVTLNLEYWELTQDHDGPYFAGGPSINERLLPARIPDFNNHSWREYGHRVGIWRTLRHLRRGQGAGELHRQRHPVRAASADRARRGQARLGADRAQLHPDRIHDQLPRGSREGKGGDPARARPDREDHRQAAEGLAVVVAPLHGEHLRHLQGAGLTYHCDYMNDEQPYLIKTAHGPLVSTPYTQEANDIGMFLRRNLTADEAFGLWKDEFDELYRAGEKSGRMMSIGLHPHIIGRAFRVRAIREFLDYAKKFDGVWWTTREEIADWYLKNHGSHIG